MVGYENKQTFFVKMKEFEGNKKRGQAKEQMRQRERESLVAFETKKAKYDKRLIIGEKSQG